MSGKLILNQNSKVSNIVSKEDFIKEIDITLDVIIKHLSSICGPFSRDSLYIPSNIELSSLGDDLRVFMHDGISTLSKIEFSSPIQQYIRNIVMHIGKLVDNKTQDGTTSSMLFACFFLKNCFELSKDCEEELSILSIKDHNQIAEDMFNNCIDNLEKYTITKDDEDLKELGLDENERGSFISFLQAYTSSGGNTEIALAIKEYYRRIPIEYWTNYIHHEVLNYSTDFIAKCEELDFELHLDTVCKTEFNSLKRTPDGLQYINEDIDIYFALNGLPDDGHETKLLVKFVSETDRPLLILSPNVGSGGFGNTISEQLSRFNNVEYMGSEDKVKEIIQVGYLIRNGLSFLPEIKMLISKANKKEFGGIGIDSLDDFIIRGASIKLDNKHLYIDNITPYDDEAVQKAISNKIGDKEISEEESIKLKEVYNNIHPGEFLPEKYINYTEYKNMMELSLSKQKEMLNSNSEVIETFEKCISSLKLRHDLVVRVGGTKIHDVLAIKEIIKDATGAAMYGNNYGIIINPLWRLMNYDDQYLTKDDASFITVCDATVSNMYLEAIRKSAFDVVSIISKPNTSSLDYTEQKLENKWDFIDVVKNITSEEILNKCYNLYGDIIKINNSNTTDKDINIPPVATAISVKEMLKATEDIMVKIFNLHSVIIGGAVWKDSNMEI